MYIVLPLDPFPYLIPHTTMHVLFCSIDGIVVAEEYEEVLREAWQQQEQLLIEKDIQKREKRIVERWKKLTRGLLIRERVKRTYETVNAAAS